MLLSGLKAKLLGGLLILAGVGLAVQTVRLNHAVSRADRWRAAALRWEAANHAAVKWAKAEKAAKEAAASHIKETANASLVQARRAGEAAADRYVERNRCVRVADQGRIERPDLPRPDSVAGQPARPAADADLVGIGRRDFDQCTAAVIDLANARAWAAELVAKGLAE